MDLGDLYYISQDKGRIIDFLREHGVLRSQAVCPQCGELMYTDVNANQFRCQKTHYLINIHRRREAVKCNTKLNIYTGSCISGLKTPLNKLFILMFLYIHNDKITIDTLSVETKLSMETVYKVVKLINSVLTLWDNDCRLDKLGGSGIVVEADELKYGGKKLRLGRIPKVSEWILGLRERVSGRLVVVRVPDRSAHTLCSLIERFVRRGTVLYTDAWPGYVRLTAKGYHHLVVNHSVAHVNYLNGAHIQGIERTWREFRKLFPRYGIVADRIDEKLNKFVFTYSVPRLDRVNLFLHILGNYINPD